MQEECRFEPGLAPCAECGGPTDEPGTCEDYALCWRHKKELTENVGNEPEAKDLYGRYILASVEGNSNYRPPHRVLHYDAGSGPVCHARGGPHPVTDQRNETNCKKCVRKIAEAA